MNRFSKTNFKSHILKSINYSLLLFIAVIAIFIFGINFIANKNLSNEKEILTNAINRDVIHCYAVEGFYPENLKYIEEKYGLNYDHDKYIINYESIGSNIMPQITIIERKDK